MTFVKWNRKSVSVICRVTWFIIRPSISNEFDIVCIKFWAFFFFFYKFYMLSVKFNYAAPFSLLKLFQSWFHPSARSFDLLATFLLVLCAFGYLTFLPFVRETFLIPWNVKRGIFLRLLFVAVYWYLTHCFAMFLIVEVFTLIIVMSKAIACIWKSFRLVVLSCLYCSWSIFYPELIRV